MAVVEVRWGDAWIGTNDLSLKKAKALKPIIRTTVGHLIDEDDERIVLATDTFEKGNEVSGPMVIPQGWILDYWIYK